MNMMLKKLNFFYYCYLTMSTGYGSGDQGYFISKSNNVILKKSSMEIVESIAMKFKNIFEMWKEEKCPEGLSKKILTVASVPYPLNHNEIIQMLRELKSMMGEQKNMEISRDSTSSLTVFTMQYTVHGYSK